MNYLANSISPMEREGLEYIWFATMNNGNLIPEYTNLWTKNNFDDVYKNRYLIKTFGLIGKKERVILLTPIFKSTLLLIDTPYDSHKY